MAMSPPHSPNNPTNEEGDPATIDHSLTDPFWHDTEGDDDDMDSEYVPALNGSEGEDEDEEGNLSYHGTFYKHSLPYMSGWQGMDAN